MNHQSLEPSRLDISAGLKQAPAALAKPFAGANMGKVLVKLGEEASTGPNAQSPAGGRDAAANVIIAFFSGEDEA